MKKLFRILVFSLIFMMALTTMMFAFAEYQSQFNEEAEKLKEMGLFKGTDKGFELERKPTRIESLVMLIRLIGKENDALDSNYSHPFTDVPEWAEKYVSYAYNNGLTKGVSDTMFGSKDYSNSAQYLTFVLRALGYSDSNGDFSWDKAAEKAKEIGLITDDKYLNNSNEFRRDDCAKISYDALETKTKDSNKTLISDLIDKGVITEEKAEEVEVNVNGSVIVPFDSTKYITIDNLRKYIPDAMYCESPGFSQIGENMYNTDCIICNSSLFEALLNPNKLDEYKSGYFSKGLSVSSSYCICTVYNKDYNLIAYAVINSNTVKENIKFNLCCESMDDLLVEVKGYIDKCMSEIIEFKNTAISVKKFHEINYYEYNGEERKYEKDEYYLKIDKSKLPEALQEFVYISQPGYTYGEVSDPVGKALQNSIIKHKYNLYNDKHNPYYFNDSIIDGGQYTSNEIDDMQYASTFFYWNDSQLMLVILYDEDYKIIGYTYFKSSDSYRIDDCGTIEIRK